MWDGKPIFHSGANRNLVTQSRWGNYRPQYLPMRNNVNRLLAEFRMDDTFYPDIIDRALNYLDVNLSDMSPEATVWLIQQQEIEHARKVLTRLVSIFGTREDESA